MSSEVTRKLLLLVQRFTKAITAAALKVHAKQLEVDKAVTRSDAFAATSHVSALRAQLHAAIRDEADLYTVHWAKCEEVAAECKQFGIGE